MAANKADPTIITERWSLVPARDALGGSSAFFCPARLIRTTRMTDVKTSKKTPKKTEQALEAPAEHELLAEKVAALKATEMPRFLSRLEVCAKIGVSYPTIWSWMRQGKFPRSRVLGDMKVAWLSTEIDELIARLPVRELKSADHREKEVA